jgi:hypothetical protein
MSIKQPLSEIIGVKYNLLTILEEASTKNTKHRKVKAVCECGNVKDYFLGNLKRGLTHSCGECKIHIPKEKVYNPSWVRKKNKREHGLSKHPLYRVWADIKTRCYNERDTSYYWYGRIGVKMCDEWINSPESFIKWSLCNGWEHGLDIDKDIIPKKLGVPAILYSPEMCCFVTDKINCRNRKSNVFYEYNGQSKTIPEWAEILGVTKDLLYKRIGQQKWSVEKAFTTPLMNNQFTFKNKTKC